MRAGRRRRWAMAKGLRKATQRSLDIARKGVQDRALTRGMTQPVTVTITEDGVRKKFRITPRVPKTAGGTRGMGGLADFEEI